MDKERKPPHPLHLAWAAGVFDAMCSFPEAGISLRIDCTHGDMMHKFFEIIYIGSLSPREKAMRISWVWKVTGLDDCREVLLLLSPFMTGKRLKEASNMMARIERNHYWIKNYPEKAALCITAPVSKTTVEVPTQP